MIEYVVLGTSHWAQESPKFEEPVRDAVQRHAIRLIAEEYPLDPASRVCVIAKRLHIPYLQIDMFPQEQIEHGIEQELRKRKDFLQGQDCRLSHADAIREEFWLEKIETSVDRARVLVICGYLHSDFLAERARERGGLVVEKSTFPLDLLDSNKVRTFSPAELEEYISGRGGDG
jgi:hypothetical protein